MEHTERMANLGTTIELDSLGKITVRELTIKELMSLSGGIATIFQKFGESGVEAEGVSQIGKILSDPETEDIIFSLGAAMTGVEKEKLSEVGVTDALKLIKTIKEVLNWEEMSKLFFELTGGLTTTTSTE